MSRNISSLHQAHEHLSIPLDKLPYCRPENSVDNPNIGFDVFQRERIDALHEKLRPHERSNNIDQNFEMYQDDPTLVRPPPPGARGNPEVISWHRKLMRGTELSMLGRRKV